MYYPFGWYNASQSTASKQPLRASSASCDNLLTALFTASCVVLQNKPVMVFGMVAITLSVAYLGYLHAMKENDQQLYEAIDSQGERYMKRKTSKWD
uniref:Small integral membrane protein 8 n=1 Tax=Fundulus heteroclitus TaxID=8078 RepID=A0A3Q2QEE0_FUNHE